MLIEVMLVQRSYAFLMLAFVVEYEELTLDVWKGSPPSMLLSGLCSRAPAQARRHAPTQVSWAWGAVPGPCWW